ncbi:MAG: class I SAM-dependent methyltransferase [Elusimicrobia bacterium]|nr:class I SAM-dependent methyltransferase [Elusimicrobiota bacterium]
MTSLRDWTKSFFNSRIFSPGQSEAMAAAAGEAAFAARALGLKKGRKVLDLCCGTGRHSRLLARRGILVTGLDATPAYLRQARRLSGAGNPRYVLGDIRRLAYDEEFDAVLNLWTSFGYFLNPLEDFESLRGICRALKPGGLFLIDVVNAGYLRRHFLPRNWRRRADGSYLLEEAELRFGRDPSVVSTWTVIRPGHRPASAAHFLRLYDDKRLSRALSAAGLEPLRRWGSLEGGQLLADSKRLVILARKSLPK